MITLFRGNYYFLSNFFPVPVNYKGVWYPTSQHAYMSAKSDSKQWKQKCATVQNPGQIKRQSRKLKLVQNWDQIKLDVMREVISKKFNYPSENKQQSLCVKLLLETGEQIMQGNSWNDKFWGVDDRTLKGENHLGKILMERREQLRRLYNG